MNFFVENMNLVLFLPLVVCLVLFFNNILTNKLDNVTLFLISFISAIITCVFSIFSVKFAFSDGIFVDKAFSWIITDEIAFDLGIFVDKLSSIFIFCVCFINFVLQLFLYNLFKENSLFFKFLISLNFLVFTITGISLSSNLFQSYLFCELVGVALFLSTNYDFSNRGQAKTGINFYIYNRVSDLFLLFCLLILCFCFMQSNESLTLFYSDFNSVLSILKSVLSLPVFIVFCGMLLFVIVSKILQSIVYLITLFFEKNLFSKFLFVENSMIFLVGVYLFFRFQLFFAELKDLWLWVYLIVITIFAILYFLKKLFFIFSKVILFFEKYFVDMVEPFVELCIRSMSYVCEKTQKGSVQVNLIHSLIGLIIIFGFVFLYYVVWIKW